MASHFYWLPPSAWPKLAEEYGAVGPATREKLAGAVLTTPGMQQHRPSDAELDEFAALQIEHADEIPDLFVPNFFFGCEADDPMNAVAFQSGLLPYGARLGAIYGSDIGHFDVPDMRDVLPEAYANVERGIMKPEDFRDFVFANPVRLYTDSNPDFFADTVVADAVGRGMGHPASPTGAPPG